MERLTVDSNLPEKNNSQIMIYQTEGRGTGIPKILRAMKANDSPAPRFKTDDDRTYFVSYFPAHPLAVSKETAQVLNFCQEPWTPLTNWTKRRVGKSMGHLQFISLYCQEGNPRKQPLKNKGEYTEH
jgi:hypothetical protein